MMPCFIPPSFCAVGNCAHAQVLSHVQLFVGLQSAKSPWTIVCQVPLSMGFSRQEYWSGLPFPPPGDLPDPGSNPCLLFGMIQDGTHSKDTKNSQEPR